MHGAQQPQGQPLPCVVDATGQCGDIVLGVGTADQGPQDGDEARPGHELVHSVHHQRQEIGRNQISVSGQSNIALVPTYARLIVSHLMWIVKS